MIGKVDKTSLNVNGPVTGQGQRGAALTEANQQAMVTGKRSARMRARSRSYN